MGSGAFQAAMKEQQIERKVTCANWDGILGAEVR
jgi:hypothetical protein